MLWTSTGRGILSNDGIVTVGPDETKPNLVNNVFYEAPTVDDFNDVNNPKSGVITLQFSGPAPGDERFFANPPPTFEIKFEAP